MPRPRGLHHWKGSVTSSLLGVGFHEASAVPTRSCPAKQTNRMKASERDAAPKEMPRADVLPGNRSGQVSEQGASGRSRSRRRRRGLAGAQPSEDLGPHSPFENRKRS